MISFDVNVLVNAHFAGQPHHSAARAVIDDLVHGSAPFGISELVLSGFVRIVTNPRAFAGRASTLHDALAACDDLTSRPNARRLRAGDRHWPIFTDLCERTEARAGLVSDAYHAALAIEHGCEWITFDRDFARFPGLRWRSPLDRP